MSEIKDEYIVVLVTAPVKVGHKIALELISFRLAACVNVLQVRSFYWWDEKVNEDDEDLLIIKTKSELFEKLKEKILSIHPYEIPEIIALPIVDAFDRYTGWIADNVLGR